MRISDWSSDVCSSDLINSLLAVQSMLPSIFISHGAPSLALGDSPARSFLESLPALLPFRPTAILIISAHWEESVVRSEEHTSELQSLMRISYAVFCLQKKTRQQFINTERSRIIQIANIHST